jgi:diguanylate cyclase (GGDEF)-like protein/PAS domain S-box-containing protein
MGPRSMRVTGLPTVKDVAALPMTDIAHHAPPVPGRRARVARAPSAWRTPTSWLLAVACLCSLVVLWLSTLQRIAFEREQTEAVTMDANAHLAMALEQHVARTLKAAEQVAAFVRARYVDHGEQIDLAEWTARGLIREPLFNIVSVVDAAGDVVASSQALAGPVNYADRAFFVAQRDGSGGADALFVSAPVLGRVSNTWQIPMSLRITRADGGFGGVVVLSVDPAALTGLDALAHLGPDGLLEVTGLDGTVRGRRLGRTHAFGLPAADLPWFQRQRTAPQAEFVDDGHALSGVPRIVGYRTVQGYPLMVTVGASVADAMAATWQRQRVYVVSAAVASLVLLALTALLAWVLARQRAVADALRTSEALFRATFHQAAIGIAHIGPDGRIRRSNDKFARMLGYAEPELRGLTVCQVTAPDHRDALREQLAERLAERLTQKTGAPAPEQERAYLRKDGTLLWVQEAMGLVRDSDGQPDFLVAVAQDISARKELEHRLKRDALFDALTGLPNRVMFQDRCARVLESARRHGTVAAVLYVDLDGFKSVNDSHGHATGDALLVQVAQRLQGCVRAEDTVARLGGDEFGLVLATLAQAQHVDTVASKILQVLAKPFTLGTTTVQISASVGAAAFPRHGSDTTALLAHADMAMYAAKRLGKNRFRWEPLESDAA